MVEQYKNLDKVLKRRAIPQMRSNLENRIIQASLVGQKVRHESGFVAGVKAALEEFFDDLLLPQPVFSMVFMLFIALLLGVYAENLIVDNNISSDVAEEYMNFSYNSEFGDVL